jgi:hypothetical protein
MKIMKTQMNTKKVKIVKIKKKCWNKIMSNNNNKMKKKAG